MEGFSVFRQADLVVVVVTLVKWLGVGIVARSPS